MKTEQDTAQYLLDQVARLTAENAMLKEKWLAQPEQDLEVLKKDWVNFGYTAGRREGYKRGYDKGWKACKYCYTNEELREGVVGYLYKQMDCHGEWATIFKVDKPYITWHDIKDIVPVYTTQPKREPLNDESICEILLKKEWRGFVDLIRIIEKCHGIGGGE